MYMLGVSILPLFAIFVLDFGTVLTVCNDFGTVLTMCNDFGTVLTVCNDFGTILTVCNFMFCT